MDVRTRLEHALGAAYSLDRELSGGGMSHVYVAEERAFGRRVVVKVLREDLTEGASAERFKREISVAAKLQHPHIVPLLSAGEDGGTLYYTMPFVEGESLRARLNREGEMPITDVMRVMRDVASALDYAHRRGIVHRDIKPDNVLFSDGSAVVTDFGIAKAIEAARTESDARPTTISQLGVALGTPAYMAPEQAAADPTVDHRADLYALGCVGYEMLAGRPPFDGRATRQLMAAHATEAPAPIGARRLNAPPALAALVMQCLEKSAADRPQSAAEVVRALDGVVVTPGGTARSPEVARARPSVGSTARKAILFMLVGAAITVAVLTTRRLAGSAAAPAAYDQGLSDAAPIVFRGELSLSIAPHGDFVVYVAETPGGISQLRYRSLLDTVERLIPGTEGGYGPQVSPDGRTVAFIRITAAADGRAGYQLQITDVNGGQARQFGDLRSPIAIRWTSPSRFFVVDDDGLTLRWFDPQSGETAGHTALDANCQAPSALDDGKSLLCTRNATNYGALVVPGRPGQRLLRRHAGSAGAGSARVLGSHFRVVDDKYLVFLSTEGELRAARFDSATFEIGRPLTLVYGIRREAIQVVGQYDIATNGTLTYALGDNAAVGRLMIVRPRSSSPQPMPLLAEAATFRWFELSPDGHRLAIVARGRDGEELRIHNLVDGRSHTWLSAPLVGNAIWHPNGDRVATLVVDDSSSALVVGSPDAGTAPDTLIRGYRNARAPGPKQWRSDSVLIASGGNVLLSLDPRTRPPRVDTLGENPYYAALSPNGRFLLFGYPEGGSAITPFPSRSRIARIPGAVEARWVSSTTVRYRADPGFTWYEVTVDSATGQVRGAPRQYFTDSLFVQATGLSHRVAPDGGMIYVRGPARTTATYLRVIPHWVEKMKHAVDSIGGM
jgi:tRNA A-37 threonylcarbamoyl transferase component Bud32